VTLMLAVVTPGPTLSVYRNGSLVATVELTASAALKLISDLAKQVKT
jgi:hypothetical protein